jgi:hypothetical protein
MKYKNITILLILSIIILFLIVYMIIRKTNERFSIVSDSNKKCKNILFDNYISDWEYDGTLLGKGKNATVYGGKGKINNKEINVAVKVIDFVNYDRFLKEVLFQIQAAANHIAPKVYDAFMCENTGYLITDKIDTTVKEYLETFKRGSREQKNMLEILKEKSKQLLNTSNKASLLHTDRHIDNFGIQFDEYGQPNLILIDWDGATNVMLDSKSMKNVFTKLEQTFQLLETTLLTPPSLYKVPEGPSKKRVSQPRTEIKSKINMPSFTNTEPKQGNFDLEPTTPIRLSSFKSIEDEKEEKTEIDEESPFKMRKLNRTLFDDDDEELN